MMVRLTGSIKTCVHEDHYYKQIFIAPNILIKIQLQYSFVCRKNSYIGISGWKTQEIESLARYRVSLRLGVVSACQTSVGIELDALCGKYDGAGSHVVTNHQSAIHWEVTTAQTNTTPRHLQHRKVLSHFHYSNRKLYVRVNLNLVS